MAKHTFKFNQRRALECKLIRRSTSHPNEFRYDLEIGDKDGSITKVPAYGKDMQDAISRHIWTERSIQIVRVFSKLENWFALAWFITLAIPAYFATEHNSPGWVFGGMTFSFVIFAIAMVINKNVNRHND